MSRGDTGIERDDEEHRRASAVPTADTDMEATRKHSADDYLERIMEIAFEGRDVPIANGVPEHACAIFKAVFRFASRRVLIYTERLSEAGENNVLIWGDRDLVASAKEFLRKSPDTEISIVFERKPKKDISAHPFIAAICNDEKIAGRLNVNALEGGTLPPELDKHFVVMDKKAYRFEYDHDRCKAVANFGDKEMAEKLDRLFSEYIFPKSASLLVCGNKPG